MGKKARKTRWRTLPIADNEYSDSEDSNTTTTQSFPKSYQPRSYYNKFSYSSQSTPRRRYQHDSTKSTRSSSTASENKITFNEDEYTKITTPRQDVLFKKGYLNKPKTYQTQTSTGTSTTSTGNSTGNGTPDHQSTDLEYESQFVFPNGFVDQNGIYYINSYETYPLMLYNPPTYYPEFSNVKSKRYSTGSLTESMSPNNEEVTSQDLSGGEASNNVSDYSGHHQVFNMVYPGYYVNGVCPPQDAVNGQNQTDQTRRIKKRRRRKTSKCQMAQDSSEYTEDEDASCNEEKSKESPNASATMKTNICSNEDETEQNEEKPTLLVEKPTGNVEEQVEETVSSEKETICEVVKDEDNEQETAENASKVDSDMSEIRHLELNAEIPNKDTDCVPPVEPQETAETTVNEGSSPEVHQETPESQEDSTSGEQPQCKSEEPVNLQKSELKPDAEEFIPRAYRNSEISEIPINPNLQFIKVPPNFIPIPIMPLGDFNGQNFNATFVPPGIPINFLHPDPKMYQNYVEYGPSSHFEPRSKSREDESQTSGDETAINYVKDVTTCDNSSTAKEHQVEKATDKPQVQNVKSKIIDIATIVYKLEEAAKEQNDKDTHKTRNKGVEIHNSPRRKFPDNASNRPNQRYKNIPNHKRNHYNSAQNSPQRNIHSFRERSSTPYRETQKESKPENDYLPERQLNEGPKIPVIYNSGGSSIESKGMVQVQVSPKRNQENKKNWKYQSTQNSKWQHNNPVRGYKSTYYNDKQGTNNEYKNEPLRNYSSTLKSKSPVYANEQRHEHHNNSEQPKAAYDVNAAKTEEALKTSIPQSKQSNQWISVSSRKKRKNKSADEVEVSLDVDEQDHSEMDLFEKYDVNELKDVVVPTAQEEEEIIKVETTEEIVVEDIISNVTQNEESLVTNIENIALNVTIRSVDDVEKELIAKNPAETETINTVPETASSQVNTGVEDNIISETITDTSRKSVEDDNIKTKVNKKSKKGAQKPQTKRVIITDVDLSMQCEELKTPLKKIVTKLNEKPSEIVKEEIATEAEEKIDEKAEPPKRDDEEEKKKNKKKKKKPSKTTITNSLSSSSATINNIDDSYDFLLDSALSPQSIEKTNVEISQEFDKIIQKGMYSSLEGKIKSMNINDSDGFFKSVFSNISIPTPSIDKNGFNKQPDLSRILQDSRSLFRSSSVSQESSSQNKETNKILPNLESPVQDGVFLKKPDVTDSLQGQTVTKDTQNEETLIGDMKRHNLPRNELTEDKNTHDIPENENKDDSQEEPRSMYPITEAVKEWMCKTRETTPDVEILKSPDAIYKEFCDSGSDTDTVVSDLTTLGDEEVTIFTKENGLDSDETSVAQQDLLECWDNDLDIDEAKKLPESENDLTQNKDETKHFIEEGEDALEAYESKYGKNEDYLNLQKEVREKVDKSNYPKHGNLPYRAICCSIM